MDYYWCWRLVGSLRNDDGDGNESGKKAIGLISKTTTLHVHHVFLYISLPSLLNYNVKLFNFTFNRGREQKTTQLSFCFSELWCSPLEFNSKIPKYWINLFKFNNTVCFILLSTSSSPCRKDQFSVSCFSTSHTDPGLQLGDPHHSLTWFVAVDLLIFYIHCQSWLQSKS